MIRLPERSVTRFFIPLIDVLLLLFCIYLLMPLAQGTEDDGSELSLPDLKEQRRKEQRDLARVRKDLETTGRQLTELQQDRNQLLHQRLAIKVLEIDARTGKLFSFDDRGNRLNIQNRDDADKLIQRHRQEIGDRELYYLFLFPRQDTGYPEQGQFEQYERWFARVPHGLDNPRGGR